MTDKELQIFLKRHPKIKMKYNPQEKTYDFSLHYKTPFPYPIFQISLTDTRLKEMTPEELSSLLLHLRQEERRWKRTFIQKLKAWRLDYFIDFLNDMLRRTYRWRWFVVNKAFTAETPEKKDAWLLVGEIMEDIEKLSHELISKLFQLIKKVKAIYGKENIGFLTDNDIK